MHTGDCWMGEAAGDADGASDGFCRHTSASLLIQENADPTVRVDLEAFFDRGELEEAAAVERHGGPL